MILDLEWLFHDSPVAVLSQTLGAIKFRKSEICVHSFELSILFSFIDGEPEVYFVAYYRLTCICSGSKYKPFEIDTHGIGGSQL